MSLWRFGGQDWKREYGRLENKGGVVNKYPELMASSENRISGYGTWDDESTVGASEISRER
jgi:hypothetical protein